MRKITIATCSLNQWALDFKGNLERTKESFRISKERGATYRLGPELELCGYGCNDHLLEMDTMNHCFETLIELMQSNECENIIGDVGMPIVHNGIRYNCRVVFYNQKILLIRPKMFLANDGNYREMRWFTPWIKKNIVEQYKLPNYIKFILNQEYVIFGDCALTTDQISFGTELCEELFTPSSPHIDLSLSGIEVFTNGSASHHEFQKLQRRIELIREATLKCGGIYLYANQQGCDGERVYYDGSALIIVNGHVLAQSSQFSLNDVEVITATIDIDEVIIFRASIISRGTQASKIDRVPESHLDVDLLDHTSRKLTKPSKIKLLNPNEEIQYGPACWLWDYLRRSKQNGFFLPLSGGIDSCSTALIVFSMCDLVYKKIIEGDVKVLNDLRSITKNKEFIPKSPQEICGYFYIDQALFFIQCIWALTIRASRQKSERRILRRSSEGFVFLNSYHIDLNIDGVIASFLALFLLVTNKTPAYKVHGGTDAENLALQNLQARSRMVVAYLFAQLLLWSRGLSGSLLVLGSSNVDETLRGYFTKYDCSSADLNPIGGISKVDLRLFIQHMSELPGFKLLVEFLDAPPTAELEPRTEEYEQTDEADMGMSYMELSVFGRLRKQLKMGPFSMFKRLLNDWAPEITPKEVAAKVKRFFFYYGINRHKTTILPPSYHMSSYSPDDNRFDLRPFLYESSWSWQFSKIDEYLLKKNKLE